MQRQQQPQLALCDDDEEPVGELDSDGEPIDVQALKKKNEELVDEVDDLNRQNEELETERDALQEEVNQFRNGNVTEQYHEKACKFLYDKLVASRRK